MFVRELPPDRGMLFLFEFPQEVAFWMKDTVLSLDLVFIDPAGKVLNIAANARPYSLDPIESRGRAIAVLEVVAGTARTIGLKPGDRSPSRLCERQGPRPLLQLKASRRIRVPH